MIEIPAELRAIILALYENAALRVGVAIALVALVMLLYRRSALLAAVIISAIAAFLIQNPLLLLLVLVFILGVALSYREEAHQPSAHSVPIGTPPAQDPSYMVNLPPPRGRDAQGLPVYALGGKARCTLCRQKTEAMPFMLYFGYVYASGSHEESYTDSEPQETRDYWDSEAGEWVYKTTYTSVSRSSTVTEYSFAPHGKVICASCTRCAAKQLNQARLAELRGGIGFALAAALAFGLDYTGLFRPSITFFTTVICTLPAVAAVLAVLGGLRLFSFLFAYVPSPARLRQSAQVALKERLTQQFKRYGFQGEFREL